MKSVTHEVETKSLPDKHLAIMFQGAWLFTQDPDDRSRILAICPYTDADDHVCEFGRWDGSAVSPNPNFVGPNAEAKPLSIKEASHHRVELSTGGATRTFAQLFESAAETYPFIYLRNRRKEQPISLSSNKKVRKISIPMADEVRPAGQLLKTPIVPASRSLDIFELGVGGAPVSSFVTFIFLYLDTRSDASVTLHRPNSPAVIHTRNTNNLHLIFRVHAKPGSPMDTYTDHVHLVNTFDTLRKLVQIPDPSAPLRLIHCDFGMFPSSGDQFFSAGDTGLSTNELGLGRSDPAPPTPHEEPGWIPPTETAFTLASCAGGAIVCNGDDRG